MFGVRIDNTGFEEALSLIESWIASKMPPRYVVTPNVDHIVRLQKDSMFKKIYHYADLVLADGMPIIWSSQMLGRRLRGKVSGSDLFPALCRLAAQKGYKLFFLGGPLGAPDAAAHILQVTHPTIQIVGTCSPLFGFEQRREEVQEIVKRVKQATPDILFVGLGAPKQELFIWNYKDALKVPVSIGVGSAFAFTAGIVRRAPRWMQQEGLEWFFRLVHEPRRLWRRYLIDDMGFLRLIAKEVYRRHRPNDHTDDEKMRCFLQAPVPI